MSEQSKRRRVSCVEARPDAEALSFEYARPDPDATKVCNPLNHLNGEYIATDLGVRSLRGTSRHISDHGGA